MLEQRPDNPNLSAPMMDFTVDSSSESSTGSNGGLQVVQVSIPVEKRRKLQIRLPICLNPHLSIRTRKVLPSRHLPSLPLNFLAHLLLLIPKPRIVPPFCLLPILLTNLLAAALPIRGLLFLRRKLRLQRILFIPLIPRPQRRFHLFRRSLPAQPVVDDSETVRTSLRSKKPS